MRISTIQAFNSSVSGMQKNYANVSRTQEQISTGKRILTPADDPVASVRLLQLSQEQALNAQYTSNNTAAQNSLNSEEAILSSIETVLQRIREIGVQVGNGTLDSTDRSSLATEIQQREDELLSLMNSKDASGQYLFGGSQSGQQPFVRNADGTYSYQGDESERAVQVASSTFVNLGDDGKDLFENVFNANRVTTNHPTVGVNVDGTVSTGRISLGLVTDKTAYDTTFPSSNPPVATDGIGIHFLSSTDYVVYDQATLPAGYDWTTYNPATPPAGQLATGALDTNSATSDFINYGGVKVQIDGVPQNGDDFTVNRKPDEEKRSLLNTVSDLRKALQGSGDSAEDARVIRDVAAVALSNLDSVYSKVDAVRGSVGARLNTLDSTGDFIADVTLVNTSVQSDLEDLDYADAISRLSLQSTILSAAQQSYVKIANLSLFNYIT
ncbi:flagellar hook-associated protein FlgL [Pseudomonas sp. GV071]|jgi:flagellar hook-associated protein 3 FlgL|uniref:flagellar hook-associated protein FlgL n=1 Tax=Pseudomonas sp. GV071 TaxID=2135754 RepID=UPI000D3AF44E|nr:flagellar hook-associated protein FlgL [Pseudomonas sp. GV071]PTQ69972.1 flagellar hook-associated protein 3 FlgL [Pseudomonas sp. GV071]